MEGVPEASGTLIDSNESNLLIIFLNTIISKENNRYHILILSSNKYYVIPRLDTYIVRKKASTM